MQLLLSDCERNWSTLDCKCSLSCAYAHSLTSSRATAACPRSFSNKSSIACACLSRNVWKSASVSSISSENMVHFPHILLIDALAQALILECSVLSNFRLIMVPSDDRLTRELQRQPVPSVLALLTQA